MSLIASPRSRKEISKIARSFRNKFCDEGEKYFPIELLLDFFSEKEEENYYLVLPDSEFASNTLAYADLKNKHFVIRESTLESLEKRDHRARYTVAHEIGHLKLHSNDGNVIRRLNYSCKKYEDIEWQANEFAAELLAPIHLLQSYNNAESISKDFGVSKQCAEIQLKKSRLNAIVDSD